MDKEEMKRELKKPTDIREELQQANSNGLVMDLNQILRQIFVEPLFV